MSTNLDKINCLLCFFQHDICEKFFHCLSLFREMLLYNNLCLSSVANATLIIFLHLICFHCFSNNTSPLSIKAFLSNSTAFIIAHRSSTSALSNVAVPIACDALNAQAVAVREYHYQTGQVMAIKEDKSFI